VSASRTRIFVQKQTCLVRQSGYQTDCLHIPVVMQVKYVSRGAVSTRVCSMGGGNRLTSISARGPAYLGCRTGGDVRIRRTERVLPQANKLRACLWRSQELASAATTAAQWGGGRNLVPELPRHWRTDACRNSRQGHDPCYAGQSLVTLRQPRAHAQWTAASGCGRE